MEHWDIKYQHYTICIMLLLLVVVIVNHKYFSGKIFRNWFLSLLFGLKLINLKFGTLVNTAGDWTNTSPGTKEVLENWHKRPFRIQNRFGYNNVPHISPLRLLAHPRPVARRFILTIIKSVFKWCCVASVLIDRIPQMSDTSNSLIKSFINELSLSWLVMVEADWTEQRRRRTKNVISCV